LRMERNTRKEMESLRDICFEIAKRTSTTFLNLGEAGKERVQSNRFGETTLRADWECEEEVLKILKKRGLNIRVISEEHGVVEIGGDEGKLLGILDGIDGTRQYVAEGSEYKSFGTLFGVFSNNDPLYKDCLASCAVEHSTGRIFMAFKGQGCFVIEQGKTRRIKLEGPKEVSSKLRMFGDGKSLYTAQLSPFNVIETSSATQNFLALLSGRGDVVSLYTLKGNFAFINPLKNATL